MLKLFNWSSLKNQELIAGRNTCFAEVVFHTQNGDLLDDIVHPNTRDHSNQRIFVICIVDYVCLVPCVETGQEIFIKTIIPIRKFTNLYLGGGNV